MLTAHCCAPGVERDLHANCPRTRNFVGYVVVVGVRMRGLEHGSFYDVKVPDVARG